jgi:methionine synthase II (cobalamin-independent)
MPLPTENVGSLQTRQAPGGISGFDAGNITHEQLTREQDTACRDSIERMEATG